MKGKSVDGCQTLSYYAIRRTRVISSASRYASHALKYVISRLRYHASKRKPIAFNASAVAKYVNHCLLPPSQPQLEDVSTGRNQNDKQDHPPPHTHTPSQDDELRAKIKFTYIFPTLSRKGNGESMTRTASVGDLVSRSRYPFSLTTRSRPPLPGRIISHRKSTYAVKTYILPLKSRENDRRQTWCMRISFHNQAHVHLATVFPKEHSQKKGARAGGQVELKVQLLCLV